MHEPYADRFWAENHELSSNAIHRGFGRIGRMLRRMIGRLVPPDQSEEACKRTYCIG